MSSNKFPHSHRSAPRLPRPALWVVARTRRAKSAVSHVCLKCHGLLPRARAASAGTRRSHVAPEFCFSSLFLVVALEADRTNQRAIGVSLRHDSPFGQMPVVALVAASQSAATAQLAHPDWTPTEICRELAAAPVALKPEHAREIGTGTGLTMSAQGEAERATGRRDVRRPGASEPDPGRGSFPAGGPWRWRRSPNGHQQSSPDFRLTRLRNRTRQLTRRCLRPPRIFMHGT
jgi:hypothetical protein